MHLLTHFRQHVERFGNIPMFSTDISELAHKQQIKDSYKASNKVDATLQILDIYARRQAFEMRLLNLKAVVESSESHVESSVGSAKILQELFGIGKERAPNTRVVHPESLPRRSLKNRDGN